MRTRGKSVLRISGLVFVGLIWVGKFHHQTTSHDINAGPMWLLHLQHTMLLHKQQQQQQQQQAQRQPVPLASVVPLPPRSKSPQPLVPVSANKPQAQARDVEKSRGGGAMRSRAGGKGGRTRAWDGPGVCLCVLVFTAIVCTPLILALALFSSWHYSRLDYSSLYHSRLDSILVFTTAVWTNLVFTTLVLIQFLCLQLLSGLIFFLLLSSLPTFASLYSCLHEACSRRYFTLSCALALTVPSPPFLQVWESPGLLRRKKGLRL